MFFLQVSSKWCQPTSRIFRRFKQAKCANGFLSWQMKRQRKKTALKPNRANQYWSKSWKQNEFFLNGNALRKKMNVKKCSYLSVENQLTLIHSILSDDVIFDKNNSSKSQTIFILFLMEITMDVNSNSNESSEYKSKLWQFLWVVPMTPGHSG